MSKALDADLLERLRAKDSQALNEVFARFERPLFFFLVGMLRDHHQAEDALQETFIQALERLDGVDGGHLRGWLFTVAYHQAMLTRRKLALSRRHLAALAAEQTGGEPDGDDPVRRAMSREDVDRCQALLGQLPDAQRIVIQQRLFDGKRFRDIADELGCPLNTALARMHQGLKRLRALGESEHE